MDQVQTEEPETRVPTRSGSQWSILQVMVVIAGLAPLLALARYPFAFGLVAFPGSIIVFVALCIRRRRYDLVAWLPPKSSPIRVRRDRKTEILTLFTEHQPRTTETVHRITHFLGRVFMLLRRAPQ